MKESERSSISLVEKKPACETQNTLFLVLFEILENHHLNCPDCGARKEIGLNSPCVVCWIMLSDLTLFITEATLESA